jgi:hypothetical protein
LIISRFRIVFFSGIEVMNDLETYFSEYLARLIISNKKCSFSVEYYPYRSTFVKIFRKESKVTLRFSDRLKDAPLEVLKAGGREMIHRLAGERALVTDKVIFRQHLNTMTVPAIKMGIHPEKLIPVGKYVDLEPLFKKINEQYFDMSLKINGIGWTKRILKSFYANYALAYGTININRAFDHSEVPQFVLEYLIYHEALHSIYPPRMIHGRLVKHTSELKKAEKSFPGYIKSKKWLKKNGSRFIRPGRFLKRLSS